MQVADELLAKGLASESRNAATMAGLAATRANELEQAARAEEKHENELRREQAEQVVGMIRHAFTTCGLAIPVAVVKALLSGQRVNAEVEAAARAEVRERFKSELRREIEAERSPEPPPSPPAVEAEPEPAPAEDSEAELTFADLPEEWRRKFEMQPQLAAQEYANAQQRAVNASRRPRQPLASRHPSFRHPMFQDS
jgi:hypothetical protein